MKTTIQVSDKLRDKMRLLAALKRTTYEELLMDWIEKELGKLDLNGVFKGDRNLVKKRSNKKKR